MEEGEARQEIKAWTRKRKAADEEKEKKAQWIMAEVDVYMKENPGSKRLSKLQRGMIRERLLKQGKWEVTIKEIEQARSWMTEWGRNIKRRIEVNKRKEERTKEEKEKEEKIAKLEEDSKEREKERENEQKKRQELEEKIEKERAKREKVEEEMEWTRSRLKQLREETR